MTTNTEHAKVLASIASQVVESYRHDNFIPAGGRWKVCTDCGRRYSISGRCHHGVDPSWQYTLPERYQA